MDGEVGVGVADEIEPVRRFCAVAGGFEELGGETERPVTLSAWPVVVIVIDVFVVLLHREY